MMKKIATSIMAIILAGVSILGISGCEIKTSHDYFISDGDFVYFVHSYYAADCDASVIATTEYGAHLTAAVARGNVYGCQFHPEKSGNVGLNILKAFCEIGQ